MFDNSDLKTATATCTGGRKVVGGGYTSTFVTATDEPRVTITQNQATSDTVWSVRAIESTNINNNWSLQAFAVCVTAP